jgi:hypothetical protein
MPGTYFKQPYEEFTVGMDFTLALPVGATVSSGTITVLDMLDGSNQTATIAPGAVTIAGTVAKVLIKAGVTGHLYNLRWRVTLNTGELLEEDATLSCQEEGV